MGRLHNPCLSQENVRKKSHNLLSVCRKKLELSTYLHTISYNHISFLTTRSQLAGVLAMSSGFYSITPRTTGRSPGFKIHFRKQPPFRGNFFPCRSDIFLFFEFILLGSSSMAPMFAYNQINKQAENLYVNYRECFGYFTQLAETSLFLQCNPSY